MLCAYDCDCFPHCILYALAFCSSSGDYDALLLARVGLKRLGLESRINQVLDSESYGYAVGQGALAILCREE